MHGNKTLANGYWLTALFGAALLLLFSLQVKVGGGLPGAPVSKGAVVVKHAAEQRHSIWQVQENDQRAGLVPEWQQVLAVAVVSFLLLSIPRLEEKQAMLPLCLPRASRNFCCIIPKGP